MDEGFRAAARFISRIGLGLMILLGLLMPTLLTGRAASQQPFTPTAPIIIPGLIRPQVTLIAPPLTITKSVPTFVRVNMGILDLRSVQLAGETTRTTAAISFEDKFTASVNVQSPSTLLLGESRVITLEIIPKVLARAAMVRTELNALKFDILDDGYPEKTVVAETPVRWNWDNAPKEAGEQEFFLSLSYINDQGSRVHWQNIPLQMNVSLAASPTGAVTATAIDTPTLISYEITALPDVHTTIGLGIAEVLSSQRENIAGTIKFIFQPAEENATGARAMIQDGVLENPRPQAIFGLHVAPLPICLIDSVEGMMLPGLTEFAVHYESTQATQAELEALTQKISVALSSLNIIPMEMDAILGMMVTPGATLEPIVLVAGWPIVDESSEKINGLQGLLRTTGDEKLRMQTKEKIKNCLDEILKDSPVKFTFSWPESISLPDSINDDHLEIRMRTSIGKEIGQENLLLVSNPMPFNSEDFSIYLQHIPGVFLLAGRRKRITRYYRNAASA